MENLSVSIINFLSSHHLFYLNTGEDEAKRRLAFNVGGDGSGGDNIVVVTVVGVVVRAVEAEVLIVVIV